MLITSLLQLFLILITIFTFLLVLANSSTSKKSNRIPSPSWRLPIVGNLHQVGSRPQQSLQKLANKYGDVMVLYFGSVPRLIVSSAAAAQDVMKTHDLAFASRPCSQVAKELLYDCVGITFAKYGDHWRRVRKIYTLHLLSQRKVQSFLPIIKEEVALVMEKIGASVGEVVNVSEMIIGLTSSIICRVAFGKKYSAEEGGGSKFRALFHEFNALTGAFAIKDNIQSLSWIDRLSGLDERVKKTKIEMDNFLENIIKEHERKRSGVDCERKDEDFVDALLSMKDDDTSYENISITRDSIKGFILEIFVGGADTTHATIEWAMAELLKHPKVMKKLQDNIRSIVGTSENIDAKMLQDMKYLKAVIKETLRLHPAAPLLIPRESVEDSQIQGYKVAAGANILINAWAIGRDPRSWDKPHEFLPERFLDSDIDFKGMDFKYIPFGAGRRGCPGIEFGVATVEIALANFLCYFDWEFGNGERMETLDMTEAVGSVVSKHSALCLVPKKREVVA